MLKVHLRTLTRLIPAALKTFSLSSSSRSDPYVLSYESKKLSNLEATLELPLSNNNLQRRSNLDGSRSFNKEGGRTFEVSYEACLSTDGSFILFYPRISHSRIRSP